jgi:hypothetical protein
VVPDALTGGPRFAAFCEYYVRHTKGRWAREPLDLEDWQRQFWWEALEVDPVTGLRVYSEVGLGLPRKNGKSVQASAAGLYFLVADGEAEPEVYVAAAARNQAGIVLGQSRRMAQQSPRLSRHVTVRTTLIECPRNGGIMRSLSADAALQHGLNPYANIIDELHAHRTADLYTALTTGTGAREQPFTLWISTAGVDGPGILSELHASMFDGPGDLEERGSLLVRVTRYAEPLGHWRLGQPRPALADNDPAVMQAIGRCAAARIRDPRLVRVAGSIHREPCGWCGFPLRELLAACDWATTRSRYVVVDLLVWRGEDGSIYLRDTHRSGIYEGPAWSAFWVLPTSERSRRVQGAVAASREGLAA